MQLLRRGGGGRGMSADGLTKVRDHRMHEGFEGTWLESGSIVCE